MSQQEVSIYDYERPEEYLQALLFHKRLRRPSYSMRQFMLLLGLSNSGSLSRILSGQRPLTLNQAQEMAPRLSLSAHESLYLFQMTLLKNAQKEIRIPLLLNLRMIAMKAQALESNVSEASMEALADHSAWAIRECLRLKKKPKSEEEWKKIWKVGPIPPDFKATLKKFKDLNLVTTKNDEFFADSDQRITLDPGKTSQAVRHYHTGWLTSAAHAIHEIPTNERIFMGTTIAVSSSDFERLESMLQVFHQQIAKMALAKDADQVVHLESFLLPVTERFS